MPYGGFSDFRYLIFELWGFPMLDMAFSAMVPHLIQLCVDQPWFLPCLDQVTPPIEVIPSALMEALMQHFKAAGFSEEVSRLATAPRRFSANCIYNDKCLHLAG